ncbi:MAG: ABC transporter permease [Proteobacteria bacterium]|nr:ABC transporter permease [Pseudomonadota bacterium]
MSALRGWPVSVRLAALVLLGYALLALASLAGWLDHGLALDVAARLAPPSGRHWFGTDPLGRDVFAMVAAGARTSLAVALGAVLVGLAAGTPLGLLAAGRGGLTDELVARGNDLLFAFPALLLAVLLSAALGPGALTAVVAIGVFNVPVFARLVRGSALSLMTRDFVRAARLAGRGPLAIAFVHLLPNLAGLLLVQAAIQLALGISAEAGLSYVGLGAQPPAPSWGRMLNEAQTLVGVAPWLAVFPGLALALAVLALGVLGDGLAARLDPRGRR